MAPQRNSLSLTQRVVLWAARKAFFGGQVASLTDSDAVSRLTGYSTDAGVQVTEQTALQISTVWSCIRVLSETVGALPWHFYVKGDGGHMKEVEHDLGAVLLEAPNADMNAQDLREAQMMRLGLVGNSYAHIVRSGPRVVAIVPDDLIVPAYEDGRVRYKKNGKLLADENVWHLKGFGNGRVGLSPVGYARNAFALAKATEQFGGRFFKDGATASGIIKAKDWLTDAQRDVARGILADMWSGLTNAHKAQLLEGGMEYESITMPLEDAQFLQTRKFQVQEICRWYRVPPHLVADLERATFTNIEHQGQEFVTYTLMPYFKRYEYSIQKLLPIKERGKVHLRFNVDGLLRGDSAARGTFYSTMLQNGVYSRNEVRALENRPRSDQTGMDDYTVQVNMQQVGAEPAKPTGGAK